LFTSVALCAVIAVLYNQATVFTVFYHQARSKAPPNPLDVLAHESSAELVPFTLREEADDRAMLTPTPRLPLEIKPTILAEARALPISVTPREQRTGATAKHSAQWSNFSFPFQPLLLSEVQGRTALPPRTLDCSKCNENCVEKNSEAGWPLHHRRIASAVTVCVGLSTIWCTLATDSGLAPRGGEAVARFCWVERLFAPPSVGGHEHGEARCGDDRGEHLAVEPARCRFTAFCRPTGLWAAGGGGASGSPSHPLFRGYGKHAARSLFGRHAVHVEPNRSKWPRAAAAPTVAERGGSRSRSCGGR